MNSNQDGCQNGRRLWSVCTCGHSKLVIYHTVASKFNIWIALIKSSPKFEHGFCPITKMATKMAATYRFALVDVLTCHPKLEHQLINNFLKQLSALGIAGLNTFINGIKLGKERQCHITKQLCFE